LTLSLRFGFRDRVAEADASTMTRPPRNPRRAYDADGRMVKPMTLGNMREHGVRSVAAGGSWSWLQAGITFFGVEHLCAAQ